MRRSVLLLRAASLAPLGLAAVGVVASCGARTGLDLPFKHDASVDAAFDVTVADARPDVTMHRRDARDAAKDHGFDVPMLNDGRILDVITECNKPEYCKPGDPGYVYKCGVRVRECASLEQCEEPCAPGMTAEAGPDASSCEAHCVNPCNHTLGQNTSNGCDFYPVEMDMSPSSTGVCYAVFLVNQWKTGAPAQIAVDLGGSPLPIEQFARIPSGTGRHITYAPYDPAGIPKDKIAILFLSREVPPLPDPDAGTSPTDPSQLANCPPGVVPALVSDGALHGTGIGTAFHIQSNVPVVAYQMLPYGGGQARITGATLLLPTNVWGTNYLAANAYHWPSLLIGGPFDASSPEYARIGPSMVVIAQADNTNITIDPVTAIVGGPGVPPSRARHPITYTIDKGQYVQFTQQDELSGSAIQSDKPVAVIGGSTEMDVPLGSPRADHGEQMLPPVQSLASQYVGVRYRSRIPGRDESVPWRLIGAVDGTTLTFDPPQAGAPARLRAHQVAEFDAPGPFVVTSQDAAHPFYMAQYMTGGTHNADAGGGPDSGYYGDGDPEFVNAISPTQYLSHYTFFTDPTYPETNLVVVRVEDPVSGQFPDVTLDCAGTLGGWQRVGANRSFEYTRIDLSSGNFEGRNGCDNGVHTITGSFASDAGAASPLFGVTIWGWGNNITDPNPDIASEETNPNFTRYVSYGYPAGANILKLNNVVLPAH